MAICISPRALISKAPAVSVSLTSNETLVRVSRTSRSLIWRAVTNFPSRPANGESLTRIRIRLNVHKLQRRAFLAISQRFADEGFLESGKPDDVTGAGMFDFDLL